jgi:hypothetical protein
MMVFEFEGHPPVEKIKNVLATMGASLELESSGFSGSFSESNAFFVYSDYPCLEGIATDQADPLGWMIGARLVVHCPISTLEESAHELDRFMAEVTAAMETRFLFSFQYESIYAVRDHELVIFKKMIE